MGYMKKLEDLLKNQQNLFEKKGPQYISKEFQDYGYRLALKLNDLDHKSLYIKLAKDEDRPLLDRALSFTVDYPSAKNKGKIFMWKLSELRKERKAKRDEEKEAQGKLNI